MALYKYSNTTFIIYPVTFSGAARVLAPGTSNYNGRQLEKY
jgi:hypothetical protein